MNPDKVLEAAPLPRATPADLERWRRAARWVPGPMGRCIRILIAEVERAQRQAAELARELAAERSGKNEAAATIGDVLMAGFRDTTAHVPDSEPCPVRGNGLPCIAGAEDACLWCAAFMPPPPGFDDGET